MKKYLGKLYVGIMLVIAALVADANLPVSADGQLQIGRIVAIAVSALLLIGGIVLIVLGARQKKREGGGDKRKLDKIQIAGIITVCVVPVVNAMLRDFVTASLGNYVDIVRIIVLYAGLALGVAMIVYGTRCKLFSGKGE